MNGKTFAEIRKGMKLTQKETAHALGYSHKVRISQMEIGFEPIPPHIAAEILLMGEAHWHALNGDHDVVREWKRKT